MSGEPLFKVGDTVIIKDHLDKNKYYGNRSYISEENHTEMVSINWYGHMDEYFGKTATIEKITKKKRLDNYTIFLYTLDIDNGDWTWTEAMFKPQLPENTKFKFKNKEE